jgi:alpha-amylase/alpha-mannosidase (GH57 family)
MVAKITNSSMNVYTEAGMRPAPELIPVPLTIEPSMQIPLRELLTLNPDNLDQAYANQAEWQATLQYQVTLAELQVKASERWIKRVEAEESNWLRDHYFQTSGIRVTDAFVNRQLPIRPKVIEAYESLWQWEKVEGALKAGLVGLQIRHSMLISWGADRRTDLRSR